MKTVNQTTGKGILEIDFATGVATITEITKDEEIVYDFFEILERYNNTTISFRLAEENPLNPVEEN